MSKRSIIFRADAGSDAGMGHFMRCLAMAQIVKDKFVCSFAMNGKNEFLEKILAKENIDLITTLHNAKHYDNFYEILKETTGDQKPVIVLDGYHFDTAYQQRIKTLRLPLVFIDDLMDPVQVADVIINPSDAVDPSAYKQAKGKVFCGHAYALLRKSFIGSNALRKNTEAKKINTVFLSLGGTDPGNLSARIISILAEVEHPPMVHLVSSSMNLNLPAISKQNQQNPRLKIHIDVKEEDLAHLMRSCDVAICSASTIAQECASVGIPLICFITADNQKGIYDSLVDNKLCIGMGELKKAEDVILRENIGWAFDHPSEFEGQVEQQKKWFDGRSPDRILEIIETL